MRLSGSTLIYSALSVFLFLGSARAGNPFWGNNQASILREWNPATFTSVSQFNPDHFRFVYQTVTGWSWPDLSPGERSVSVLKNPSLIVNNPKISASVIDEKTRTIFREGIGFILKVPTENLIFTSARDAGSPRAESGLEAPLTFANVIPRMKDFIRLGAPYLFTPIELLILTNPDEYNEIGVMGHNPQSGAQVNVEAVVITAKSLGCTTKKEGAINSLSDTALTQILKTCGFSDLAIKLTQNLRNGYPILLLNL